MSKCTHRRPAGARAVAEGHKGRQDDHKTTKGTEQRGETEKQTQSGRIQKRDVAFAFTKGKFSYMFIISYKDLSKWIRSPLHYMTALVYSSHPIHWHVLPEKLSLQYPHTVVLKKIKVG